MPDTTTAKDTKKATPQHEPIVPIRDGQGAPVDRSKKAEPDKPKIEKKK